MEKKYFIRTTGYSGNSLIWWRPEGGGYTTDLDRAGKYSQEEAAKIVHGSGTELAYECDKVYNLKKGLFTTVHADYLGKSEADIHYKPTQQPSKHI